MTQRVKPMQCSVIRIAPTGLPISRARPVRTMKRRENPTSLQSSENGFGPQLFKCTLLNAPGIQYLQEGDGKYKYNKLICYKLGSRNSTARRISQSASIAEITSPKTQKPTSNSVVQDRWKQTNGNDSTPTSRSHARRLPESGFSMLPNNP